MSILIAVVIFFVICPGTNTARAGQAILTWDPPTTNSDGTPLTDLAGYKVYYGPTSGNYSTVINVTNVTSYTVTGLNDNAAYYFATTAYNTSSNESVLSREVSKTTAGTSDITAPVLSNITTGNITSTSAVITWTTNEQSSSQIEYGTTTAYGSSTTIDNTLVTSHTASISGLSSWTIYHYRVKSRDAAGNLAASGDYTFTTLAPPDITPPTGTIAINNGDTYATSTSATLTFSCSDAGSGCSQMRSSNTGNVWENYVTSWTWTLSSGDGVKTVSIQYSDAAGNLSQVYSDTITLDTTSPVISGIGTGNLTSSGVTISWTTGEGANTQVDYGTTTSYGAASTLDANSVTSHTVTLSGLSSSTLYHYRVKSRDAAGNLAASGDYTFTTLAPPDITPPTGTITINNGDTYATSTSATLTFSCSDAGSGCSQMRSSNTGNVWENYVTSKAWTLSSGDGVKTVSIQYSDAAGNSSQVYSDTITLDTTSPVVSGIGTGNLTPSAATISWTTGEGSNTQVDYGTTTSYGASSSLDANSVTSHSVTLSGLSSSTLYHYRVNSRDAAGNLAASGDYTFTTLAPPDITPPTGTITISNGDTYATSTSATITFSCSDAGSGCSQMRSSNTGNVWENYVTSWTWTLSSGDGVKTVSIQYSDAAGNLSQVYSDTITLDTTSPVISGIGTGNLTSSGVTISWTTGEGANTQVDYGTTTSYGASSTLDANSVTSHSVTLSGLSSSTLYHYRVKSRDTAGNLAASGDYTFTTLAPPDTTAPVFSYISTGNITSAAAAVTWTTDEASTSLVEYGSSSNYGSFSSPDSSLATSHTVTLSGLTPNTTYYFRVLSSDQAGNQGVSANSNFTTLNAPQPDIPAAIQGLTVRAGASRRNSVILDWTATGADGNVGTASAYDLRMSTQKIIEDGITPAHGEINFSTAAKITGIAAPKIAGTPEAAQVGLLDTNSVYYFAIKAIDNTGNVSGISTVVNGNALPPIPVTAVRQGYTMISIPLVPATSNVQTLLRGILGTPVELYWWNSTGMGKTNGTFVAEANIVPGYGYFLKSNSDNAVLNITGTAVSDPSRAIPLQPGWSMIGNPYPVEVALRNTYIRNTDTGVLKNYEDAVIAGWVGNEIYNYNGSTYDFSVYTDAILKIWQGYWVEVLQNTQFEIVIYKP